MTQDHCLTHASLSNAAWRASTYSGSQGNCVEMADGLPALVPVRDSKHPTGPAPTFAPRTWHIFITNLS